MWNQHNNIQIDILLDENKIIKNKISADIKHQITSHTPHNNAVLSAASAEKK